MRAAIAPAAPALIEQLPPELSTATISELISARDTMEAACTAHRASLPDDTALAGAAGAEDAMTWLRVAALHVRDAFAEARRQGRTP